MRKISNPFQIEKLPLQKSITFLLISNSLSDQMVKELILFEKFSSLNRFKEIRLEISPIEDIRLLEKYDSLFLNRIYKYNQYSNHIVIEYLHNDDYSTTVKCLFGDETYEEQFNKIDNNNLNHLDLEIIRNANDLFHFIVLSDSDYELYKSESNYVIPLSEVLEYIRLYMLNHKNFQIQKCIHIDEPMYYVYIFKKSFYEYQRLWSYTSNNSDVSPWSHSLSERMKFYCKTYDEIKLEFLQPDSHTTRSNIKHYFNHLILTITEICDNIAWILNYVYDLKFEESKKYIGIRKENKNFLNALSVKDSNLNEVILSPDSQNFLHSIYPLRDIIVHRESTDCFPFRRKKLLINAIYIPIDCYNEIKKNRSDVIDKAILIKTEDAILINPFILVRSLNDYFCKLVNSILAQINLDKYITALDHDQQKNIEKEIELSQTNLYKFLDMICEPLYF